MQEQKWKCLYRRIRITDVHPTDAYYNMRKEIIGSTGILVSTWPTLLNDWEGIDMKLDSLEHGGMPVRSFYAVRFEEVD